MTEAIQKIEKKRSLPSLNDLYSDESLETLETIAELMILLNADPSPKWIKEHNGIRYLPIDRIEWLLSRIFVDWYMEVLSIQQAWNGIIASIRLHYFHPIGEWRHTDGVGAAKIQFKKGQPPTAENIVQDSVERAPGAAKSFALKNAAKKLGKLFGARLNQSEDMDYYLVLDRFADQDITEPELIELKTLADSCSENLEDHMKESGSYKKIKASLLSVIKYQTEHGSK